MKGSVLTEMPVEMDLMGFALESSWKWKVFPWITMFYVPFMHFRHSSQQAPSRTPPRFSSCADAEALAAPEVAASTQLLAAAKALRGEGGAQPMQASGNWVCPMGCSFIFLQGVFRVPPYSNTHTISSL